MPVAYNPSDIYNMTPGFNLAAAFGNSGASAGYGGGGASPTYGQSQSNYQNWLRYQQGLGINSAMQANAGKYGQTALQNIGNWSTQAQSAGQQGLVSRGLGNTTILNAMNQGVGAQATQQKNAVAESQAMMQNSILGNRQQWIGSRTDQPAMSPYQGGIADSMGQMAGTYGAMNQQMMNQGYMPNYGGAGSNAQPQGVPGAGVPGTGGGAPDLMTGITPGNRAGYNTPGYIDWLRRQIAKNAPPGGTFTPDALNYETPGTTDYLY
jgi:hypothetical protein